VNTLDKYKQEVLNIFLISIDKDIDKWKLSDKSNLLSPKYSDIHLYVDLENKKIYTYQCDLNTYSEIFTHIANFGFFSNFRLYLTVRRLKKNFKKMKEDAKFMHEIEQIKNIVCKLEESFVKEIRKEKLTKIKNT
jgi:hypothetical protein